MVYTGVVRTKPMSSRYLPKIKTETVKSVAQKFATTASGKKVSKTAFKKFLKEDKDLKHLTYADKRTTMTKTNVGEFRKQHLNIC